MPASSPSPAAASRTGPLRNGNPRGNPALAPRCGAKTRAGGCCQAPALRGRTRCRLHGGASTGPRTVAGLARLAAARTTHGGLTQHARAELGHLRLVLRCTRVLTQAVRCRRWLPEALRARLEAGEARELMAPPHPSRIAAPPWQDRGTRGAGRDARGRFVAQPVWRGWADTVRLDALARAAALEPWRQAIGAARAAARAARLAKRQQNPLGAVPPAACPGGARGLAAAAEMRLLQQDPVNRENGGARPGARDAASRPGHSGTPVCEPHQDLMDREAGAARRLPGGSAPAADMRALRQTQGNRAHGARPVAAAPGAPAHAQVAVRDRAAAETGKAPQNPMNREHGARPVAAAPGAPAHAQVAGRDRAGPATGNTPQNPMKREHGARPVAAAPGAPAHAQVAVRDRAAAATGNTPQNPLNREHGAGGRRGWAGDGPLVTRLWGDVASPPMGLRARLLGGTRHDGSPFWIGIDGGLAAIRAGIAAGEDTDAAIKARAWYARR